MKSFFVEFVPACIVGGIAMVAVIEIGAGIVLAFVANIATLALIEKVRS